MKKRISIAITAAAHIACLAIVIFTLIRQDGLLKKEHIHTVQRPTFTPIPTGIPEPTETPIPIGTPEPTETPIPIGTPEPTETPIPTSTPEPTEMPKPTETPEPTSTMAPTNIPELAETTTPVPDITEIPTPMPTILPTEIPPELTPSIEPTETPVIAYDGTREEPAQVLENIRAGAYDDLKNEKYKWWFRRKKDHVPTGSGEEIPISEYSAYYRNKDVTEEDKVIYMTIDCGYGSANTGPILETFKKYGVKATFFVTKFFIDDYPKSVLRMLEDGHAVANHSVTHADLTSLTPQGVYDEIMGCEEAFYQLTGQQMAPFFRPPEGAYSVRTLQITEDLGYKTVFWSIAYNDYDKKNQPGKAYVIDHFNTYHHNGAIPLMHNDSSSNKEAMDEVLALLVEQGYRFGTLDELQ